MMKAKVAAGFMCPPETLPISPIKTVMVKPCAKATWMTDSRVPFIEMHGHRMLVFAWINWFDEMNRKNTEH